MSKTQMQDNVWKVKAKALDRYRWLLLRERYSWIGSFLRFVRDALRDWSFGVCARCRVSKSLSPLPCDILLLQSAPKVIALRRKKLLIEALLGRGHVLIESALQSASVFLRQRQLKAPPFPVPTRYFGFAAHAEWLVCRYTPKLLLNDRNGSLYAPFLRLALNMRKSLLVQLAHATTLEKSQRLGMNDYDYYLLFGASSEAALRNRLLRFGESTAVLTGSHMIDKTFDMPMARPSTRTILVLGVGPDKEKEENYQKSYRVVSEWASQHPEILALVKRHPRSKAILWQEMAKNHENMEILPAETSLADALARASIVINFMSNAIVEASLAKRPIVYVNAGEETDIFDQEYAFGSAIKTPEALAVRIQKIEQEYAAYVTVTEKFSHFHLAGGFQGLERTVATLESLMNGTGFPRDVESMTLPESLPGK
ncbi:MAG: hypothetical protein LBF93_12115 [Zoogloeaceae bacterium]|jgi:hypothetical protein|nr:hypothetical protein [Zoogloeaceae bacterium]